MIRRYLPLLLCSAALVAGFTHAALTLPDDLSPAVRCYEDGSCSNGYCEPLQLCDDSRDQ